MVRRKDQERNEEVGRDLKGKRVRIEKGRVREGKGSLTRRERRKGREGSGKQLTPTMDK